MLFEIGVFDCIKAHGLGDIDAACVLAENELGFEKNTTANYIRYFEDFLA